MRSTNPRRACIEVGDPWPVNRTINSACPAGQVREFRVRRFGRTPTVPQQFSTMRADRPRGIGTIRRERSQRTNRRKEIRGIPLTVSASSHISRADGHGARVRRSAFCPTGEFLRKGIAVHRSWATRESRSRYAARSARPAPRTRSPATTSGRAAPSTACLSGTAGRHPRPWLCGGRRHSGAHRTEALHRDPSRRRALLPRR